MHTEARAQQSGGSPFHPGANPELTQRELAVLRLIAEQVAVPLDQLSRFAKLDAEGAERIAADLGEIGCVGQRTFLAGEAPWLWLTNRGARLSGTGFPAHTPSLRWLAHRRVLNEVRLWFAALGAGGHWVCERELCRHYRYGDYVPDAVVDLDGEYHAVEVELSSKPRRDLRKVLACHSSRYERVVYFCGDYPYRLLKSLQQEEHWPKLVLRRLPASARAEAAWPRGESFIGRELREPTEEERAALRVIVEQGAVPLDQLARFIGGDVTAAEQLAEGLREAACVNRERLLANEPDWLWPGARGARLSGTGLGETQLRVGALSQLRVANEVRLLVAENDPEAYWVSYRMLMHEYGRHARLPRAVVETEGERHAVEIYVGTRRKAAVREQLRHRRSIYDAVVVFANPTARWMVERLANEEHWRNVLVRPTPSE